MAGLKQADLARQIGISASYLNLIEHNRRRIGGKLLVNIAHALGVEPSMLTEGAEATLIATLREAAADAEITADETDRADEFAGRFPAWAEVLASAHRRIASLERTVEILSDRLTHDPHLAASVHELLSTAAAIRSTAQILAEPGELEREWRDRFHRNLNEDSLRLAESCKALVDYLDESGAAEEKRGVPQEELEAFVAASGYHYPELETSGTAVDALVQNSPELTTGAARQITAEVLGRYAVDARKMPLARMKEALDRVGFSPLALSEIFATDLASVLRRLASMPPEVLPDPVGLVTCDAAGSLLFRKPVDGFAVPRFGATCPLWPLFTALARPLTPLRRTLTQEGRGAAAFDAFSIAQPVGSRDFNQDPLFQATMLIRRIPGGRAEETPEAVGSTCRVCPRSACQARREPSILSEGF